VDVVHVNKARQVRPEHPAPTVNRERLALMVHLVHPVKTLTPKTRCCQRPNSVHAMPTPDRVDHLVNVDRTAAMVKMAILVPTAVMASQANGEKRAKRVRLAVTDRREHQEAPVASRMAALVRKANQDQPVHRDHQDQADRPAMQERVATTAHQARRATRDRTDRRARMATPVPKEPTVIRDQRAVATNVRSHVWRRDIKQMSVHHSSFVICTTNSRNIRNHFVNTN
jgi:hypothetical protein